MASPVATDDCCMPAVPALPLLPDVTQSGSYACFLDCQSGAQSTSCAVQITGFTPDACDFATASFSATVGSTTITGMLNMQYSRSWKVMSGLGPSVSPLVGQVWRYLINMDATVAGGGTPCPRPPCTNVTGLVHWVGHLDMACFPNAADPVTQPQVSLSLTHLPGCMAHNAGGLRPVSAPNDHPTESYHLVTPGSFNWFTPAGRTPAVSNLSLDTMRETPLNLFGGTCARRVPLGLGNVMQFLATEPFCPCGGVQTGNHGWWDYTFEGSATMCGAFMATFRNALFFPTGWSVPGTGSTFSGLYLGAWTAGPTYPFDARLSVYWGYADYRRACSGDLVSAFLTGVATEWTLNAQGLNAELFVNRLQGCCNRAWTFVDLHTSFVSPMMTNNWGALFRSDLVLAFNS